MSRTIYIYTVEVLKKVSFNPKLFKRELEKASKKLLPHEYMELMIWAKNFKVPFRSNLKILKNKLVASNQNNDLLLKYFLVFVNTLQ